MSHRFSICLVDTFFLVNICRSLRYVEAADGSAHIKNYLPKILAFRVTRVAKQKRDEVVLVSEPTTSKVVSHD